jgi:murein DD-endopeptidase MepM/ murein hydrolase activator NlpD
MMVERGGLIGTIGATGRATGPHLDWRIDWQGRRIDPGLLVGAMPDPES